MTESNALGEYLKARRQLIDPAEVGLRVTGVRRTPGLRREEVATLSGISADYYLRLEQGRDRNPSPQVLEALARVFRLDAPSTQFLLSLSGSKRAAPRHPRREVVPPSILQLLDVIGLPAFVEGSLFAVLATNRLATALAPSIRVGRNRMLTMFLDQDEQDLYPDWEQMIGGMIAAFRTSVGTRLDDPQVIKLVGELSLGSERFRQLWARHDVKAFVGAAVRMQHPQLGILELSREKLPLGDSGQLLVIYHAEPGSESERSLALLGSLAASESLPRAAPSRVRWCP